MDIYFCDLCGVRVSDADLRTGQGQRSRYDVICASCLEQGLGKEWLGKRASARRAAVGAKTDAADRVATIDDEAEAPVALAADPDPEPEPVAAPKAVAPKPVAPEPVPAASVKDLPPAPPGLSLADDLPPAPPGLAIADDEDIAPSPSLDEVDQDHEHDAATVEASGDTAKVPSLAQQNQLSLAASAFSALGKSDRDDDEEDDDLVDRAYATPAEQLSPALGTPALAEGQSPFARGLAPAEKDETALVPALPGTDEADLELDEPKSEKKPGTSTSSRRKSAKGTSSRIVKSGNGNGGKGKSSRNRARGKDNSRAILMYSLISLGVILLVFGAVMATKSMGKGTGSATGTSVVDDKVISKILTDVERQAVEALRSNDLTQLRAAREALKNAQQKVYQFEDDMVKQGNSQEQVEGVLRRLNASDRFMHIRTINDAIFKLEQQGK